MNRTLWRYALWSSVAGAGLALGTALTNILAARAMGPSEVESLRDGWVGWALWGMAFAWFSLCLAVAKCGWPFSRSQVSQSLPE